MDEWMDGCVAVSTQHAAEDDGRGRADADARMKRHTRLSDCAVSLVRRCAIWPMDQRVLGHGIETWARRPTSTPCNNAQRIDCRSRIIHTWNTWMMWTRVNERHRATRAASTAHFVLLFESIAETDDIIPRVSIARRTSLSPHTLTHHQQLQQQSQHYFDTLSTFALSSH